MSSMVVRRIGVFSLAKIQALIMGVFGIILGVIYGLVFMVVGGALLAQRTGETAGAGGGSIMVGLMMMIGIPIFYAFIGFIAGALSGLIYNIAAGFVGGIELELEAQGDYSAPPPPPQWSPNPYQQ